ncbi:MAG: hypothetical protein IJP48_07165 [Synergistaceae bacterium]|nr:hypothetical protein [Synergistaceae bacterium]
MTLNKDLFFELCEEYGVQFSSDYETAMLCDDDGSIRRLCEEDVEHIILPSESESIPYNYSDNEFINTDFEVKLPQENFSVSNFADSFLYAA